MTNKKKKGFKLKQPGRTPESTPTRIKQKKWTDDQMLTAISDVKKGKLQMHMEFRGQL